ncbi:unnamed protein product [Calypogeia fissa]
MVSLAAHIPGHAASHVARLKEEAYAVRHSRELFYPFALEVFGALHSALDRFFQSTTALCVPPGLGGYGFFLGSRCRLHFRRLRPSRSSGEQRWLVLGFLGMFLSLIRL